LLNTSDMEKASTKVKLFVSSVRMKALIDKLVKIIINVLITTNHIASSEVFQVIIKDKRSTKNLRQKNISFLEPH